MSCPERFQDADISFFLIQRPVIIKADKPNNKIFLVDEIMTANGHTARLAPHITNIGGRVRTYGHIVVGWHIQHLGQLTDHK